MKARNIQEFDLYDEDVEMFSPNAPANKESLKLLIDQADALLTALDAQYAMEEAEKLEEVIALLEDRLIDFE